MYYGVDVPAGEALSIEAMHTQEATPVGVDIDLGCTRDAQSLCQQDSFRPRKASSVVNNTGQTQRYIVALDVLPGESYWVEATLHTLHSNAFCEQPLATPLGIQSPAQSWHGAGPEETLCYEGSRGRALYYNVTVPAGHRLYPDNLTVVAGCGMRPYQCSSSSHANLNDQPADFTIMTSQALAGSTDVSHITPYTVELAPHSQCTSPRKLISEQPLTNQSIRRGLDNFNPCNIVLSSHNPTLYYSIAVPLGGSDFRVIAQADDPTYQNTLSLQVVQRADDPSQCYMGACEAFSDGYFRGDALAEVIVSQSIGGGRDPALAIIAVTMQNGDTMNEDLTFSIRAEALP